MMKFIQHFGYTECILPLRIGLRVSRSLNWSLVSLIALLCLIATPTLAEVTPLVAAGDAHNVALKSDGGVVAWGYNNYGQLGDGATTPRLTPVAIPGLTGVIAVASGSASVALKSDGTLMTWGQNIYGQLGDGTTTQRNMPVLIPGLTDVVAVSAGAYHVLALKSDGSLLAWGKNSYGELGDGSTIQRNSPVTVPGLTGVVAMSAGAHYSIALKSDGTVMAWGANWAGQLGDGSKTNRPSPVPIPGLNGVAAVSAGGDHTLALKSDGTVMAWGWNQFGALGDGTLTQRSSPVVVQGLAGIASVSAGGADHSVALKSDGTVMGWGSNGNRQLGDTTSAQILIPVAVPRISGAVAVVAGGNHTVVLKSDGAVVAFGSNPYGELGDGTFAVRLSPVAVVNETTDGYLNLKPGTTFEVPPSVGVPFFVAASGDVSGASASVSTTTKFNASDVGKSGAVFVTATVPPGSLVPLKTLMSGYGAASVGASALTAADSFVLINLTASGWQPVVSGQLMPYASGVLGDQISAQTILNSTDTTNLKGAQFCVGYGSSAEQMIAVGTMRVVATIPGVTAPSCIIAGPPVNYSLPVQQGWNLLGNSLSQPLSVTSMYSDPSTVTTVWKWDGIVQGWQFYTPQMDSVALQTYAASKGYSVLSEVKPGEGYWVNAKAQPTIATQSGDSFILTSTGLAKGWNLVATGNDITPSQFNTNLKSSLPGTGVTTLWAWGNLSSQWYFYAPSLDAGSSLSSYITSKGYLDFTTANKTLGQGVGFWVNKQ